MSLLSRLPRRDRHAFWVSVAATLVALVLAFALGFVGPAKYSPEVAVLTATLVAIIWYTFFTFQAVHREGATWVTANIERRRDSGGDRYVVTVSNPTERVVHVQPILRAWTDGRLALDRPLGVKDAEHFPLGPREVYEISPYLPPKNVKHDPATGRVGPPDYVELLVELTVVWNDEVGRSGSTLPKHWHEGTGHHFLTRIVSPSQIAEFQRSPA
jgi:hypothetical protein